MARKPDPAGFSWVSVGFQAVAIGGVGAVLLANANPPPDHRYDQGPQPIPMAAIAAISTASGTGQAVQIGVPSTVYGNTSFAGAPHERRAPYMGTSSSSISTPFLLSEGLVVGVIYEADDS